MLPVASSFHRYQGSESVDFQSGHGSGERGVITGLIKIMGHKVPKFSVLTKIWSFFVQKQTNKQTSQIAASIWLISRALKSGFDKLWISLFCRLKVLP